MTDSEETKSWDTTGLIHIWSHWDCNCTHETYMCSKQTDSQHWEEEVKRKSHPNKETICNWCLLARGNRFSRTLSECVTEYSNHTLRETLYQEVVNPKQITWFVLLLYLFITYYILYIIFYLFSGLVFYILLLLFHLDFHYLVVRKLEALLWEHEVGWIGRQNGSRKKLKREKSMIRIYCMKNSFLIQLY